uniref:Uncharacterized protein n=1 Tax=viral metagenome TaxID=1070528 RepID=A0A2V0RKX4_9ZZZZ
MDEVPDSCRRAGRICTHDGVDVCAEEQDPPVAQTIVRGRFPVDRDNFPYVVHDVGFYLRGAPRLGQLATADEVDVNPHVIRRIRPRLSVYDLLGHFLVIPQSGGMLRQCMAAFESAMRLTFPHAMDRAWTRYAAILSCVYAIMLFSWNCDDGYVVCPTWSHRCLDRPIIAMDCQGLVHQITHSNWWRLPRAIRLLGEEETHVVVCPWCNHPAILDEDDINCGTFRCGVDARGQPLPIHARPSIISAMRAGLEDILPGCGRIFFVSITNDGVEARRTADPSV